MTRRTRLSLLYAGTGSSRWFHVAVSTPDADLLVQCVRQWKNASAEHAKAASERPVLRLPQFPPPGEFIPAPRKPHGK